MLGLLLFLWGKKETRAMGEELKLPDYKLIPMLAYWNGKHFPPEFVIYRCPSCGSIGERESECPGHDTDTGTATRRPVVIPWPDEVEDLRREIKDLDAMYEEATAARVSSSTTSKGSES